MAIHMAGTGRRSASMTTVCSEGDCGLPHYAKDLCAKHYSRVQYRYASNADRKPVQGTSTGTATLCPRCRAQAGALADVPGADRVTYLRALTDAQRSAYITGYLDGRGRDPAGRP